MKLPILMIAEVLEESIPEINWFVNQIEEEKQVNPPYPLGRIVELSGDYIDYASEQPNYLTTSVQVDVWVRDVQESSQYYFLIDKVMREEGIQCTYTEETQDQDLKEGRRIIKRYVLSQRVL